MKKENSKEMFCCKPYKGAGLIMLAVDIVCIISQTAGVLLASESTGSILKAIWFNGRTRVIMIAFGLVAILYMSMRFIFDRDGVKIHYLFFREQHRWEEYNIIQIVKSKNNKRYMCFEAKGNNARKVWVLYTRENYEKLISVVPLEIGERLSRYK